MTISKLTPLKYDDFLDDARLLGCEPEAIQAVARVESKGSGFDKNGFPITLFEAHWFHKLTKGRFTVSHPHLSSVNWNRSLYGRTAEAEAARLQEASGLDRTAALQSASWGLFQIMGFNHASCGHKTVQSFVNQMCKDHNSQLALFVSYIQTRGLADELRDRRWADFARLYNGSAYAKNKYDQKLETAYQHFKSLKQSPTKPGN